MQKKESKTSSTIPHKQPTSSENIVLMHHDSEQDNVHIQFLEEILTYKNISTFATDASIQILASQGASMCNAHITTQGQILTNKINKESQTLQTSMQSFQNKAQVDQQAKLQNITQAFSQAMQNEQAATKQASIISNMQLDYLEKNISSAQPQQNYLFSQIQFDQLFSQGSMLTPDGAVWKNPFSVGDWEYEKDSNSFWQYQITPITNKTTNSSAQAENNCIFTEYVTTKEQYHIAGSITIYYAQSPFFIGILCNKARWISGDFESIRKGRMIGIYGKTGTDIGVYFAQQYTMNAEQMKKNPNDDPTQTPLQQIINNKVDKKVNIPADVFMHVNDQPVTINFDIVNSPKKLSCTLTIAGQEAMNFSVNNLDPSIYMHHGIGFISPGAIAQFKLTQPQDLLFTDQALLNFKD